MKLNWNTYNQYASLKLTRSFVFYFLVVFLSLSFAISIPIWVVIAQYNKGSLEIIKQRELGYLNTASQSIQRDFFGMIANVEVVSQAPIIKEFLIEGKEQDKKLVTNLMRVMAEHYQRYNQVRLLDIGGNEIIRINYKDGKSSVVKPEDLQNKSRRDYFQKVQGLNYGEVYISPMELNSEQDKIEIPHQPTIIVAMPLFNNEGVKKGIFVVNYEAKQLTDNFKRVLQQTDTNIGMLINSDGYYLISPIESEEFGFMYKKELFNLSQRFPSVWEALKHPPKNHLYTSQGLFLFESLYPLKREAGFGKNTHVIKPVGISEIQANDYRWYIVIQVPEKELIKSSFLGNKIRLYILVLIYVLISLISLLISTMIMKSKIQSADKHDAFLKMQSLAQVDGMTNIFNRRFFCELAEREVARVKRSKESLSLMMLDIDHFKKINDTYGHDVGDQAIISFCLTCKKVLRELDIFGRMGGEEFSVLMPQTTIDQATVVAERLRKEVSEIVLDLPEGKIFFTVSIGITSAEFSHYDLSVMLKDADKAMYIAKSNGRNQIYVN